MRLGKWCALFAAIAGCFATATVALAQPAQADDRWAVEPHAAPWEWINTQPRSPSLIKSLADSAEYVLRWKLPIDAEGWRTRRPEVEGAFRKAIGLEKLPERTPLNARVLARNVFGDYSVENVLFESRPGFPVSANLYRSLTPSKGKRPAVLCPIGHYLSAGKTTPDIQARCIKLARMGFVVLVYDAIGHGERMIPGNIHHEAGYALLPLGETIAGWMVWDSMRGIDYLLTLEDVDPERIGVTGNSGGGLNTLFTAALDERVRVAVEVGFTFEFGNWIKYGGTHCTCTHLPGLFRSMQWFEIAGLVAPRALMMIHGEHDGLFPISGARRAGHDTEALYTLLGQRDRVRFAELPGQPHAYSRPYRERMYGWMARHLLGQGSGDPIPEGDVQPLPEKDRRLLCDPDASVFPGSPTVVELARKKAIDAVARLPVQPGARGPAARWVRDLAAPPDGPPHYLFPDTVQKASARNGVPEKIAFTSEEGEYIPGLLWLPERRASPAKTVILVDSRGKQAVAESGLVPPLVEAGFTVLSVDLRGRGETLGRFRLNWNTNFRMVANQILFGQPLPGRRAFDLVRALDYLGQRGEPASGDVSVVGIGEDALPVLLAAATDTRIRRVAAAGYFHSFISQMRAKAPVPAGKMAETWNDAQLRGRLTTGDDEIDLGSVIPSALDVADVPDIAALIAPRRLLFCQARDNHAPGAEALASRLRRVIESAGGNWVRYEPGRQLDGKLLLEWLKEDPGMP
jgi:cephalosporin-C deacetylase-like acetyl esterase